jgi:hypothetical protein
MPSRGRRIRDAPGQQVHRSGPELRGRDVGRGQLGLDSSARTPARFAISPMSIGLPQSSSSGFEIV